MRSYDLAPLYRSTVGFDRLFSLMDQLGAFEQPAPASYPPYNIEKISDNEYRISLAEQFSRPLGQQRCGVC